MLHASRELEVRSRLVRKQRVRWVRMLRATSWCMLECGGARMHTAKAGTDPQRLAFEAKSHQ